MILCELEKEKFHGITYLMILLPQLRMQERS